MLRSAPFLTLLLVPGTALAEVCDKVAGDLWSPDQGAGATFVTWSETWTLLVVVAVWVASAWRARSPGMAWVGAVFSFLPVLLTILTWGDRNDPVVLAAVREGCMSSPFDQLRSASGFLTLAILFIALATSGVLSRRSEMQN